MMTTRPATERDINSLASRLRKSDVDTIHAMGTTPKEALRDGLKRSDKVWCVVDELDEPQGIFGVVKDASPGWSVVWMLGTDDLTKHRVWLLRRTLVWAEKLRLMYGCLCNWEDARNADHIQWLKWCGFTMSQATRTFKDPSVKFIFFYSE